MGEHTANERPPMAVGETRNFAVSFVGQLDSGETISSVTSVTEVTTSVLTITNKAVNSAAVTINEVSVGIGLAVQFTVAGQVAASSPYTIKILAVTSGSQTLVGWVTFPVESA